MSRTKKLLVLLLAVCMAVSAIMCLSFSAFAEGETAANVVGVTTSTGNSGFPIRIHVNTDVSKSIGNGAQNLNTQEMSKVTFQRGGVSKSADVIQGHGTQMYCYFKSSTDLPLTLNTLLRGDILNIAAGFVFSTQDGTTSYIINEEVNYIYDGAAWIKGTELPSEAQEATANILSAERVKGNGSYPMRVDVNTNVTSSLGDQGNLLGADLAKVTFVRGDVSIPASVIQGHGTKFYCYFAVGNSGLDLAQEGAQEGDKFIIDETFSFKSKDSAFIYTVDAGHTYVYDGTKFVEDFSSFTEMKIESITTEDVVNNDKDSIFFVNTDSSNETNFGLDNYTATNILNYITFTFPDGSAGDVWTCRVNGSVARFFIRTGGTNLNINTLPVGSVITIKPGFRILATEAVQEEISFVYDGEEWSEFKDTAITAPTRVSKVSLGNGNTSYPITLSVSTNMLNLGSLANLTADKTKVTYTRGDKSVNVGVVQGYGSNLLMYFASSSDLTLTQNTPEKGDVLKISAGFTFDSASGSCVYKTAIDYVFVYGDNGFEADLSSFTDMKILSVTTEDPKNGNNDTVFFVNTDSANEKNFGDPNYTDTDILNYVTFTFPDGTVGNVHYCRVNNTVARFYIRKKDNSGNINNVEKGSMLTFSKGFRILPGEALKEDVTYIYTGSEFQLLKEPTDFSIAADQKTEMIVGSVLQINVKAEEGVNVNYTYKVSDDKIATIDYRGKLTAIKAGKVTVTVSYKDISKTIEITVRDETTEEKEERELVIEQPENGLKYYVPVSTDENPTSVWTQGFDLQGKYIFADGSESEPFAIKENWLGSVEGDYKVPGEYQLVITDDNEFETVITVVVYEYKDIGLFNSIGVSGYDIDDDRNPGEGTWNGHMMIGLSSYSTNTTNLLSQNELNTIASYIEYTTADGKVYLGSGDDKRIGVWQIGANMLVMIKPEGATTNMGYSSEDHYKGTTYAPIYKLGDKITFKEGMPIYAWIGNKTVDPNRPIEGEGYLIVEGYLDADYTYYCYEEDGTKSLWQLYKEYTDFKLNESMTITAGGTASVGAVRVPSDATLGTFSYESSDSSIVTVTQQGNMIGMKVGTATITVTLSGGVDAEGNPMADIVKTMTVTVKRGISKVEGSIELKVGSTFDPSAYEVTVTFTDGTTEKIKLNDERVVISGTVDTSATGEQTYSIAVTIDGETKRGQLTVNVTNGGGCSSAVLGVNAAAALLVVAAAGVVLVLRKKAH